MSTPAPTWTVLAAGVRHAVAPVDPAFPYHVVVSPRTTCCGHVLHVTGQAEQGVADCPMARAVDEPVPDLAPSPEPAAGAPPEPP